jgi:prepilin-type N-terminal cleavage/methylation domain-containing protein
MGKVINFKHNYNKLNKQTGFTIVELLVVIVVIGILAAISVISYRGVTKRATVSVIKSELVQSAKKIELYKIENGIYPSNINCVSLEQTSICIETSGSIEAEYLTSDDKKFYALKLTKGDINYHISSSSLNPKETMSDRIAGIAQPATMPIFLPSDGDIGEINEYNNLYINPEPAEPAIDSMTYVVMDIGVDDYRLKFMIGSAARSGDEPPMVAVIQVNSPHLDDDDYIDIALSSDLYVYVWEDISADILELGNGDVDYKKGWNKVEIRNSVNSHSKTDYLSLPNILNTHYLLAKDEDEDDDFSQIGKYMNTEPYVYRFGQ